MSMAFLTGHVLPILKDTSLGNEDGESTTAIGQILRTLYNLTVCGGISFPGYGESDCRRLIRQADDRLAHCLLRERHSREKARLIHARYDLLRATAVPLGDDDLRREDDCRQLARRLILSADTSDASTETVLCRCALDVLYPDTEAEPDVRQWLTERMHKWMTEAEKAGRWCGIGLQTAAERIEILHESACTLPDATYASQLQRLRTTYADAFRTATDTAVGSPDSVRLWLALYRLHFVSDYRPDHALALRLQQAATDNALPRALRLAATTAAAHAATEEAIRNVQERLVV